MPGVYALNVGGAVRVGDYSSVGKVFSYSTNLEYSPIRDLRLRGTVSQATRAPNITELYSPQSQDFPSVTDRSEEHTSELQSLMRISYAVFCLKKKNTTTTKTIEE